MVPGWETSLMKIDLNTKIINTDLQDNSRGYGRGF